MTFKQERSENHPYKINFHHQKQQQNSRFTYLLLIICNFFNQKIHNQSNYLTYQTNILNNHLSIKDP